MYIDVVDSVREYTNNSNNKDDHHRSGEFLRRCSSSFVEKMFRPNEDFVDYGPCED